MEKVAVFVMLPIAAVAAAACATSVPPTTTAAQVERAQCVAGAESNDSHVIQTATVLSEQPLYSHVVSRSGDEERVDGAKLVIRPPEGMSADRMTRILQCYGARALLGNVAVSPEEDPFWAPDQWVSVEVHPENGNYAVTVEAGDLPANIKLAERAQAYAQAHAPANAPSVQ